MEHLPALSDLAPQVVAVVAAIFTRLSALVFFLPGLGEKAIPVRVRLAAAMALTLILYPAVGAHATPPQTVSQTALMIAAEAVVGALIGFSIRIAVYTIQTAGSIASQSLSLAQLFSSGLEQQPEPAIATLLTMSAVVIAVVTGLHFEAVNALVISFKQLPLGTFPGAGETGEWAAGRAALSFGAALSLALPFVMLGFIYNLAIGAANRAMPQLMVAFVGVPAVTLAGLVLLAMSAPVVLHAWLIHQNAVISALLEHL